MVAAYVSNNSVPQADLPSLIASIHTALRDAANGKQQAEKVVLEPPVSVKKSITANHLISMEDGRPYKSLKRHPDGAWAHPGAVSGEVVAAGGLSDGRTELFQGPLGVGQGIRPWADKEGKEGWEEAHGLGCRCAGEKARCLPGLFPSGCCHAEGVLRGAPDRLDQLAPDLAPLWIATAHVDWREPVRDLRKGQR